MAAARVILVSDAHLSANAPRARANWDAVISYVGAAVPDMVIHLGELSLDGAHDAADLRYGRRQLDRLPVAWHAVPGNHDVGDNPWPGAPDGTTVDADSTGAPAEAAQWSWLEERASERREHRPVALITHKPVTATGTELAAAPPYRFWPRSVSGRLAALFDGAPLTLVMSGHVHQHRLLAVDGAEHLWVPTTWAVLPDQVQPASRP